MPESLETPSDVSTCRLRLAIVVTHPIQYYVPLYRRLAAREDVEIRVFYTWHGGEKPVWDVGFEQPVAWDIPLTDGYPFEVVPNCSKKPGSDHFWGIQNPTLATAVEQWQPDAVHLTGYAFASHLGLLRRLRRRAIPVLFRGDSHLLTPGAAWKEHLKRFLLRRVFSLPAAFLYVGQNNRAYYEAYGVPASKLYFCPHSIDNERFARNAQQHEQAAAAWRRELGIGPEQSVLLFAGKFEPKKQPVALMRAVVERADPRIVVVMVGGGALAGEVDALAGRYRERFRVLPFQNQGTMPVVYRLGDLFVLPSSGWETWGLAVNEAFACGRAALVSDQVGCAPDLIQPGQTGDVFRSGDWEEFAAKLNHLLANRATLAALGRNASELVASYSLEATERTLVQALRAVVEPRVLEVSKSR